GAVGEVVGTAAALQSVARPASVLVGPATRSATEGLFEWGPTVEVALSPLARPLLACYADRLKARPAWQAGRRGLAAKAPMVGRELELGVLRDAIRRATAGDGTVVELVGEPGLGKTRLVHECRKLFLAWVGAATGRLPLWLEGRAASYASATPYGLYQHLLGAWVGIAGEDNDRRAHAALERALKAAFGGKVDDDELVLISQVMGLSAAKSGATTSQLGPEPLRQASFAAVSKLVSRLLQHGPTVIVLEDLHWSDPTSLRLTEQVSSLTTQGPLLLLITRRPEPDPGLADLEATLDHTVGLVVRKLELSPLAESQERDLTRALLGPAPDDVVDAVTDGAEGNPLFLEERLASLLETRALVKAEQGGWRLDDRGANDLPEALERLVRARVDRLGEGPRKTLVAASVFGAELTLGALYSVTDLDGDLDGAVGELCSSGLLVVLANVPEPTYRFRHALIQEATYKSLLKHQRQKLHARAARALEQVSGGWSEEAASVLGHHFALAGDTERAAHYLDLAADRAAQSFANDEAIASYHRALELLGSGPDMNRAQAAQVWLKLGRLLQHLGRYGEARAAYQKAVPLAAAGQAVEAAKPHIALGLLEVHDRRHDEALAAFAAAEVLLPGSADQTSDDWAVTWIDIQLSRCSHHWSWNEAEPYAAVLGRLRPVVGALGQPGQKANFYAHVAAQRSKADRFMVDDSVIADYRAAWAVAVASGLEIELNYLRWLLGSALLCMGDIDGAKAELEAGLGITRRTGDRSLELRCLTFLAWAHLRQHDVANVRELARESEELAGVYSYPEIAPMAKALLAWAAWKEGRLAAAGELAEEARDSWKPFLGLYPFGCACLLPLAAVRLAEGRGEEAVRAAVELLEPPQLRLPVELEKRVGLAISAWDGGQQDLAGHRLTRMLQLAERMKYI
ncbi:MAG TPA: AAA family ATPase, partial [Acidimicrobiales bacterium]|nr:AAA family ATPase [Acidimicrobiales bacterium]